MFGFLKPKTAETLIAHLPTCLPEADRVARFDTPVQTWLQAEGFGAVTGARTVMGADDRIERSEIALTLTGLDGKKLDRLVAHFDSLGSPKGSSFRDGAGKVLRPFGTTVVVVLELDGAALPAEATVARIGAELLSVIEERVSSAGRLAGGLRLTQGMELYFHCRSPRIVEAALAEVLATHPLCRNARVFRLDAES